ncbi:MAG: hypothetical protein ACRDNT_29195 [Streptosporangiaceae bacterium]
MPGDHRCRADAGAAAAAPEGYPVLLRAAARGLLCEEAAAGLLIGHGRWLWREEFTSRFVHVHDGAGAGPAAVADWGGAVGGLDSGGGLACSASEACVLRIAASLGGGLPVSLRAVLGGLDHVNIALVAEALLHANGTAAATVTVPAPAARPPGVRVAGAGGVAGRGEGRSGRC